MPSYWGGTSGGYHTMGPVLFSWLSARHDRMTAASSSALGQVEPAARRHIRTTAKPGNTTMAKKIIMQILNWDIFYAKTREYVQGIFGFVEYAIEAISHLLTAILTSQGQQRTDSGGTYGQSLPGADPISQTSPFLQKAKRSKNRNWRKQRDINKRKGDDQKTDVKPFKGGHQRQDKGQWKEREGNEPC